MIMHHKHHVPVDEVRHPGYSRPRPVGLAVAVGLALFALLATLVLITI
jgi:hypothetical protein